MTKQTKPGLSRKSFLRLAAGGATAAVSAVLMPAAVRSDEAEIIEGSSFMHTRSIPSSNEFIPVIGLGTWQAFDVGNDPADHQRLGQVVDVLFADGGRVIDSSPMYGRAEQVVGGLLVDRQPKPPPFVATKVWTRGREDGVRQMKRSEERLCRAQIDLMQVHNLLDWRAHLDTLRGWKVDGVIRYLGVTHYATQALDDVVTLIETEALDFIQIAYSATVREAEQRLFPAAAAHGTAVIVNRPFEGGHVFRQIRQRPLPDWAEDFECESWAQIFLKYIVSHPVVTCVIPGTGNPEHMRDNVGGGKGVLPGARERKMIADYMATL